MDKEELISILEQGKKIIEEQRKKTTNHGNIGAIEDLEKFNKIAVLMYVSLKQSLLLNSHKRMELYEAINKGNEIPKIVEMYLLVVDEFYDVARKLIAIPQLECATMERPQHISFNEMANAPKIPELEIKLFKNSPEFYYQLEKESKKIFVYHFQPVAGPGGDFYMITLFQIKKDG